MTKADLQKLLANPVIPADAEITFIPAGAKDSILVNSYSILIQKREDECFNEVALGGDIIPRLANNH